MEKVDSRNKVRSHQNMDSGNEKIEKIKEMAKYVIMIIALKLAVMRLSMVQVMELIFGLSTLYLMTILPLI